MKKMKYVVVDDGLLECPYIFSNHINHSNFVNGLKLVGIGGEIISAGFVNFDGERLICFGESVSLGVKARPEDTTLINSLLS